jgi:hypothetical protein
VKRPTVEQHRAVEALAKNMPDVVDWMKQWYEAELEALPFNTTSPTIQQGRCQVLQELVSYVSKPNGSARR